MSLKEKQKSGIQVLILKNREKSFAKSRDLKKKEASVRTNSKFLLGLIFFILATSIIPTFFWVHIYINTPNQTQPISNEFISSLSFPTDAEKHKVEVNNVENYSFTEKTEDILLQNEQESTQQDLLGAPRIKLLYSNEEGIEIEFSISELIVEDINAPTGELYQKLSILGGGRLANIGKPELPTKGIYLDVPVGAELELQIKNPTFREENGYNIYPYQPSQVDSENNEIPFEKNLAAYQINSFYPSKIANIMDVGIIRAHRTALVLICPVIYNPYLKKIRLYTKINIHIKYTISNSDLLEEIPTINEKEKYNSDAFQSMFKNMYLNYQETLIFRNDTEILNRGDIDNDGANYLIISADQFYDNILPLAQNKEQKGFITKIVNLSEIGTNPSADNISTYIQNAYETWDPAPSYLLLVGDSNLLPVHYKNIHPYTDEWVASDLYYATVDGTDYFPDIFVGRLPVKTDNDLDIIINKILNYEINFNPTDVWRLKVLLAAHEELGKYFINTSESIRQYLENIGYICNTVYSGGSYSGTTQDIINYINEGTFLVNHRDHGSYYGWAHPSFKKSDINSLSNGDMLPVMFSLNCESGRFDFTQDCFGEALLKAQNKGVVGYIGSTRISYSGYNDELDKGLITSIWPEYSPGYTNYVGTSPKLGAILNFGKIYMYDKYVLTGGSGYPWEPTEEKTLTEFEEFNLLGDPELTIIPSQPFVPSNPFPPDGAIGVSTNPTLSVDVSDPNGDTMDVYFYNASDENLIGINNSVSSGRTASISWFGLSEGTIYEWYAVADDGIFNTTSPTWSFTTSSATYLPDLTDRGSSYSGFNPMTIIPGISDFDVWCDVENIGTVSTGTTFNVSYYASTDATITISDYLIGNDTVSSIAAGDWEDSSWSGTFSSGISDGTYYIGWIIDSYNVVNELNENNNEVYISSYQLLVDGTPPSNPTTCDQTEGSTSSDVWQNIVNDPSFSWSGATDSHSGVAGYYYYWGTDLSGTDTMYTTSTSYDPSAVGNGTYYLRVHTIDNAGNLAPWTTLYIFKYDETSPSNPTTCDQTEGSTSSDVWQNIVNDPSFSWSGATDSHSGVAGYYYYWGTDLSGTDTMYTTSTSYDPSAVGNGTYYLRVHTIDNAGNLAPWTTLYIFKYDDMNPSSSLSYTPEYSSNYILNITSFSLSASDGSGSGVDTIWYRIDDGDWIIYSEQFTLKDFDEGLHTIEYYSVDNVGNTESLNSESVYIDLLAPITNIQYVLASQPNIVNESTKFSLSAHDGAGSGIDSIFYRIDDGDWIIYSEQFTLKDFDEGLHTIEYYSVDNVGNIEKSEIVEVYLKLEGSDINDDGGGGGDDDGDDKDEKKGEGSLFLPISIVSAISAVSAASIIIAVLIKRKLKVNR